MIQNFTTRPNSTLLSQVDTLDLKKVETLQSEKVGFPLTNNHDGTPHHHERGKKLMGIELAPLNVPWHRRMETLSVFLWMLQVFCGGIGGTLLIGYCILYTRWYSMCLVYLAWYLYDFKTPENGGRRFNWMRKRAVWTLFANYFPIKLIKTVDLDPSKNYLFASHPHGVICCGSFASFGAEGTGFSKIFPGLTPHPLTLNLTLRYPLFREYVMSYGFCSASRESMDYILNRPEGGHVAVIMLGGAAEALDAHPGPKIIVHLEKRKGFIKVALRNGCPLVPVFNFGENDVFNQPSNEEGSLLRRIQNYIKNVLTIPPILMMGRGIFQYSFGLLPHRRPITVVVGGPILVQKVVHPTQQQVDDLHSKYVQSLVNLFETHKAAYGNKDSFLKIV